MSVSTSMRIFRDSMIVFLFLNIIENYLHYTIGRSSGTGEWNLPTPNRRDVLRIGFIMIVFAILQGSMTVVFEHFIDTPSKKKKTSGVRRA